jgi:putative transposase
MYMPTTLLCLKRFSYPREIVVYAVWAHHRFCLTTSDTKDLLAERGEIVSREAIRLWVNRFGRHFADCICCDRPRPNHKWHRDEVVFSIQGKNSGYGVRSRRMETSSKFSCKQVGTPKLQSASSQD